jgi:hypothetical protein
MSKSTKAGNAADDYKTAHEHNLGGDDHAVFMSQELRKEFHWKRILSESAQQPARRKPA